MKETPSLSLIICTYRRPLQVQELLRSLAQQTTLPDEVLVIDGSPDTETETVVQANQAETGLPSLLYYQVPPQERGLTRQRNYGIARAAGNIVAFLDDDTIPEPTYFTEVLACFQRHPAAAGIGGYIVDPETSWQRVAPTQPLQWDRYRFGTWERRLEYRRRLRRLLRLDSPLPPGWMPPAGHGLPVGYLPPDGEDYQVEFIMGGASTWKCHILLTHKFSRYFEGYGLYEDLDYCIRASREGPVYLCTRARLAHHHAPSGRPNQFDYGVMVVRNGWFVWRRRWPSPAGVDCVRWWAVTLLLSACRLGDAARPAHRTQAISETLGRLWGLCTLVWSRPQEPYGT